MQQRMAESFAENITRYLDFVIEDITSTVYNVLTFSVAYKAKVWNAVGMMLVILVYIVFTILKMNLEEYRCQLKKVFSKKKSKDFLRQPNHTDHDHRMKQVDIAFFKSISKTDVMLFDNVFFSLILRVNVSSDKRKFSELGTRF